METLATANYAAAPHAQMSHLRESRIHPTRPAPAADLQPTAPEPTSTESSQNSTASVQSNGSSLFSRLVTGGSNASQLTDYSDLTSPVSSTDEKVGYNASHVPSRRTLQRERTPEELDVGRRAYERDHALASPMSITSPVTTNGSKRTASGHVKNGPSLPQTPYSATFGGVQSRRESITSTNSRAGELAATLKARLGYAAVKVQRGWQHKSLAEVEQLAGRQVNPNRHSMSHLDQRPGTSGLSNGTANLSMYEPYAYGSTNGTSSPPSKRHSASFTSLIPVSHSAAAPLESVPRLQPPADIRPAADSRQVFSPPLNLSSHPNAMSPPRTPMSRTARRPPTLWTDTHTTEAERDALQALSQLGSPHTSQLPRHQSISQGSSSQASPLRSEFATPRKVTFARSDSSNSARPSSSGSSLPERTVE